MLLLTRAASSMFPLVLDRGASPHKLSRATSSFLPPALRDRRFTAAYLARTGARKILAGYGVDLDDEGDLYMAGGEGRE